MTGLPVYLDYNATTPCDPEVVEVMLPFFSGTFGNAASRSHVYGLEAEEAVDIARRQVASLIEADTSEIIFTSGATEAVNLAIRGTVEAADESRRHIITWNTEHKAVLDVVTYLSASGIECTVLPVNSNGLPDMDQLADSLRKDTLLVSMMAANNETGVIMPIREAASLAHAHGALLFTDATQAVGKIPFSVRETGADLAAFSAHKVYGPKGAGAMFVKRGITRPKPLQFGGGHEGNLRSGTLNVPGIVGMGEALRIAGQRMKADAVHLSDLRARLLNALKSIPDIRWNAGDVPLLPHVASITFGFRGGDRMLAMIARDVAASSGSACSSAIPKPSHVLAAMGLNEMDGLSTIRFSLGRSTTEQDIDRVAEAIVKAVGRLRE